MRKETTRKIPLCRFLIQNSQKIIPFSVANGLSGIQSIFEQRTRVIMRILGFYFLSSSFIAFYHGRSIGRRNSSHRMSCGTCVWSVNGCNIGASFIRAQMCAGDISACSLPHTHTLICIYYK